MIYFRLFYEFLLIGLFAVGGGLATLPFLSQLGEKTAWFSAADLADMVAISESTPGPLGVNMATYTGYTVSGVGGAIVAVAGLVLPSIVIIIIVAQFLKRFKESKLVQNAFYGLRPASCALIAAAGFEVLKMALLNFGVTMSEVGLIGLINFKAVILAIVLFILVEKTKKHPVVYIAFAAIVGMVFKF